MYACNFNHAKMLSRAQGGKGYRSGKSFTFKVIAWEDLIYCAPKDPYITYCKSTGSILWEEAWENISTFDQKFPKLE